MLIFMWTCGRHVDIYAHGIDVHMTPLEPVWSSKVELRTDIRVGSWSDIQIVALDWMLGRCPELVVDQQTQYLHVYLTYND